MRFLKEFFAVTITGSLYHATMPAETRPPVVTKIARKGEGPIGLSLVNGDLVSVGKQLIMFIPEGCGSMSQVMRVERDIAKVSNCYLGGHTSDVVALFLEESDARACLEASNLVAADQRWLNSTSRVLDAIGSEHPRFVVATYPDLALLPKALAV
jgi:hypothetical protein